MIVGAALKARGELAGSIGWHAEAFARIKDLKPLTEYLKPAMSADERREEDARRVMQMLDRLAAKEAADGSW